MTKRPQIYSFLTSAVVGGGVLLLAPAAWAQQTQSGTILQESITATKESTEAMDKMWQLLFAVDSNLYNQVIVLASAFVIASFFFLMVSFGRAVKGNDLDKVVEIVFWALLVIVLLFNNGAVLKEVTVGARDFINDQAKAVLLVQVGDFTIQEAEQDIILTDETREKVKAAFSDCEAKEGQAQLLCLEEGAQEAAQIIEDVEASGLFPPGVRRLSGNINQLIETLKQEQLSRQLDPNVRTNDIEEASKVAGELLGLLWQSSTNSDSKVLLKSFQNWFTFGYEFAMLLTGLLGPLSVAASLIPKQPRAFISWVIAFFSIGMLKLSYNLLVGFAALYASMSTIEGAGGSPGFLLMMSIGAPLISVAIAGGGGAAIFFALGRTTAMVATIVPIGGSVAGGIGSSIPNSSGRGRVR